MTVDDWFEYLVVKIKLNYGSEDDGMRMVSDSASPNAMSLMDEGAK